MGEGEGSLTEQAIDLRYEGRDDEAVALLRKAVDLGEPDALPELAYALLNSRDPAEAVRVVEKAVKRGRTDLYSLLASLASEVGDARKSERAYRAAIESGDASALNDYGIFLRGQERYRESIEILRRACELGDVLAPGNLVATYANELGDLSTAIEIGERYVDPGRPSVYPALAAAYAKAGRLEQADDLFRQGIEVGSPKSHQAYAWFLWTGRNDPVAAERQFWLAFDADEPNWSLGLGELLIELGRREEARAVLERGAEWGDLDARALLNENGL
ncbi:tetratricopeptide repeat protein [Amycolatopsis sp. PS_44_ISF1]|uniref:tetratricopeptide repeat protein n=1 Tax=Amycolatopsis sp. PS_44_ISF1 TaxID=2974917 RepID=UPI0028DFFA7E|nr:tetratricopeptide repeat protein [Amycolatopsis sp. PS_44_ISF1]MDT8914667.1 tetratricopeptide repeat protein [Amycolatopsis sp. PS_44_ISF1]